MVNRLGLLYIVLHTLPLIHPFTHIHILVAVSYHARQKPGLHPNVAQILTF